MDAFAECKPPIIIAVPLIIEKIIKNKVFPLLDKPLMKFLMMIPFVDNQLLAKIKAKLEESFGGNLKQIIVGETIFTKEEGINMLRDLNNLLHSTSKNPKEYTQLKSLLKVFGYDTKRVGKTEKGLFKIIPLERASEDSGERN